MQSEISVVHLVYVPFGTELFERFLDSYIKHPSGIEHQLVVMFNGFDDRVETEKFLEIIDSKNLDYKVLFSEEKFDISSYFFAAENLNTEYVLFLNSYSIILADGWLRLFYSALQTEKAGVVGATGAGWRNEFQSFLEREKNERISSFAVKLKAMLYMWLHFGKAAYPHLRTNAFFARRKDFLSIEYHRLFPQKFLKPANYDTKNRTLYFEHGNKSLTAQFNKKGLKILLIDKYGNSYEPPDWMAAKTFWISEQENLLVHDNQTLRYENGDERLRKHLTYLAWGIESENAR